LQLPIAEKPASTNYGSQQKLLTQTVRDFLTAHAVASLAMGLWAMSDF